MKNEADRIQLTHRCVDGPASRWKQAERLANRHGPSPSVAVDDLVGQTAAYLNIRRCGVGGVAFASEKYPVVDVAVRVWDNDAISEQLQVLAIADCPREEIASRLQLNEQVVAVVERLFFDVRRSLKASGWIVCHVIIPLVRAGALDLASKLKLAYFGGPAIARAILDARVRVLGEEAARLFDREVLLQLKVQEALEAPLGEGERIEFLRLYLQYDIERQRLDLEKRNFAQQRKQKEGSGDLERRQGEAGDGKPRDEGPSAESNGWCDADNEFREVTEELLRRLVA